MRRYRALAFVVLVLLVGTNLYGIIRSSVPARDLRTTQKEPKEASSHSSLNEAFPHSSATSLDGTASDVKGRGRIAAENAALALSLRACNRLAFLRRGLLMFYHTPKSGGSSISYLFSQIIRRGRGCKQTTNGTICNGRGVRYIPWDNSEHRTPSWYEGIFEEALTSDELTVIWTHHFHPSLAELASLVRRYRPAFHDSGRDLVVTTNIRDAVDRYFSLILYNHVPYGTAMSGEYAKEAANGQLKYFIWNHPESESAVRVFRAPYQSIDIPDDQLLLLADAFDAIDHYGGPSEVPHTYTSYAEDLCMAILGTAADCNLPHRKPASPTRKNLYKANVDPQLVAEWCTQERKILDPVLEAKKACFN
eukprot:TRINITY_DN6066_c0_g1_i1.p1 TRINITY_DN6066_c0_g1~~TRINITY_DN6066_c0_g1_i1.p1  ORF type:complete len:364 (-),score=26.26 TRINITY_DN6066_c0_g1_i1:106-1197(-)